MKIIDNNIIDMILSDETLPQAKEIFYATEEVISEAEIYTIFNNKTIPKNIKKIPMNNYFDESLYLSEYKNFLNSENLMSFYNMKGFGDISILATIKTLLFNLYSGEEKLPGMMETIEIFTLDVDLIKRINFNFRKEIDEKIILVKQKLD